MNAINPLIKSINNSTNNKKLVNKNDTANTDKKRPLLERIGSRVADLIDFKVSTTSYYITEEQKKEIKNLLEPGDILLETDNEYPVFQIIEKAALGTDWTHMVMYMGDSKIAEATTTGEKFKATKSLDKFLNAYHIAVVRPQYKTETDKTTALQYMKAAEGRLYDPYYDTKDESKLYCSEGPYHALRKMPNPIELPLTYIFGRDVVSPSSVLNNPDMKLIWTSGSNFWKNQLSHYPLGIGTVTGAGALAYFGTTIGHPIALAIGGAIAGLGAAWGAMKLIWPSLDSKVQGY